MEPSLSLFADLEGDHRQIELMYKTLELECTWSNVDVKKCKKLLQNLATELRSHSMAEENVLYEACFGEESPARLRQIVRDGEVEHHLMDHLLIELEGRQSVDDVFCAQLRILGNLITNHIQLEETILFPEAKRFLASRPYEEDWKLTEEYRNKKREIKDDVEAISAHAFDRLGRQDNPFWIFSRLL